MLNLVACKSSCKGTFSTKQLIMTIVTCGMLRVKLIVILVCVITACIDIFIEILVIYVIQCGSEVLQMLIQELLDLVTLAEAMLIIIQQMTSSHYCNNGYSSLCKHPSY